MLSLLAIKGNISFTWAQSSSQLYSPPVLITNLKSEHRSRKPSSSILISSQFPEMFKGGWVDSGGGPPSSSTNSEKTGDVMVERVTRKGASNSSDKLRNEIRITMDRSDPFPRNLRRPSSWSPANRYA